MDVINIAQDYQCFLHEAQIMWHAENLFSNIIKNKRFFFPSVANSHVAFFVLQVTDMISVIAQVLHKQRT